MQISRNIENGPKSNN